MSKPKQKLRSREELLSDLKKNADFQKKMSFTKNVFYPALIEASKNIDDAQTFLGSINTVMMESFLGYMKEKKFGELKLQDKLDTKDEKHDQLVSMLDLFNDMSIFEAKDLLEGMKREISLFLSEENKVRKLSDIKPQWLDELS